ncbi:MAG: hypothetical protein DI598_11250 [Pseudopedobacter saltans]|uniref:Glycosyltransferase RgtA/B/C/D-like domain-containing protein n=1 Tax=Pseudopedobacter saltans TaxID=151895 RepID=A0A2W5GV33_9SPHI|nr:MAG: hypothetical protein DI598_11250 [Pseudopedobacter saltans]
MKFQFFGNKLVYLVLLCYILVNVLFLYKYVPEYPLIGIVYTCLMVGLFFLNRKRKQFASVKWIEPYVGIVIPICILLGIVALKMEIPATRVDVDRWSALFNWTKELFQGNYPYYAKTHLGQYASPFPIWEIIHIPFYFLGDEIFAHILMVFLLVFFLRKSKAIFNGGFFWILLILSPAYWWEVAVRSDLMNNLMVTAILMVSCEKYLRSTNNPKTGIVGLLAGLLLCTRLFVIFPLGIYFFAYMLKWDWRRKTSFTVGTILGFLVPMLPFLLWNKEMFIWFKFSPIHLQTQFGNSILAVSGIVFLFLCSLLWKSFKTYIALVAVVFFGFISLRFFQEIIGIGWNATVYQDGFDVSYFNVCLPFAILCLAFKDERDLNVQLC